MLSRLGFPSIGPHRRFVTAIAVDAMGSGVWMPVSMLYFLAVTSLSLVQVGAAISIAALVALPSGPVLGMLVDRLGAKRVLLAGNLMQVAGFTAYLFVDTFVTVLAAAILVILGMTSFWGAYGNIVAAISLPGERERWFGFLGALRNVGFAIGGLASGLAVAIGTDLAFSAVVAANAASYAVAFWLLLAVPVAPREPHESLPGNWGTVLRDGPYRLLVLAQVGYSISIMILIFALPVYAVEVLDLPGWVGGVVFTVNCVMVGLGQGLVVNALTGHVRYRVLLLAQATFATSYVVFLLASELSVWVATVVVVAGCMVYTLAELMGGPVLERARRGGGARAPARPLPLADPARLEHQRHGRSAALRVAARQRAQPTCGWSCSVCAGGRGRDVAARTRAPARRAAGHQPRGRDAGRHLSADRSPTGHPRSGTASVGCRCERSNQRRDRARRSAHRRRGLPRTERRDPGGGAQGRRARTASSSWGTATVGRARSRASRWSSASSSAAASSRAAGPSSAPRGPTRSRSRAGSSGSPRTSRTTAWTPWSPSAARTRSASRPSSPTSA